MSDHKGVHDWVMIAQYDTLTTFIDLNSVRFPNGCIRALVRQELDTPGVNKITGKKVVRLLIWQTFEPKARQVKSNEGLMIHEDGSEWPLGGPDGKWAPVEGGTIKVMDFLSTLGKPILPSDMMKRRLTPVVAMGIVNPMGPTLCGLCLLDQGRRVPPELVRYSLNPFSQEATVLRTAAHEEAFDPLALLREYGIGADAAGTLVFFPTDLDHSDKLNAVVELAVTRSRLHVLVPFLRKYPRDPWNRVSAEMRSTFVDGEGDPKERDAELSDYIKYLLDHECWSEELGALVYAWKGSIDYQADQGAKELAAAAMPVEQFRNFLIRIDAPAARAEEEPLEQPDPAWSTGWWKGKAKDLFQRFRTGDLQKDPARPFDTKAEDIEAEITRCLMNRTLWNAWDERVLLQLMHAGLVFYGATNDADMVESLFPLYVEIMKRTSAGDRLGLYQAVRREIADHGNVSVNAMMPFLIVEEDDAVVATAALDFVLLRPTEDGDPLAGSRHAISMLERDLVSNRGAFIGGLITVGDRRIHELLERLWPVITSEEINVAVRRRSGFPNVATFGFWLRWLEKVQADKDDGLFGSVASGLGVMLQGMQTPGFVQGLRPLGAGSKLHDLPPTDNPEFLSVADLAERFSERMYALEKNERPPKVMSHVLKLYGLEPRAPLDQQYVMPERQ